MSLEILDPAGGLAATREGLTLARRLGHRSFMFNQVLSSGWFGFMMGDWDRSLAELDTALADDPDLVIKGALLRQTIVVRASRGEPVEDVLTEMDHLDVEKAEPQNQVDLLTARAAVAFAVGDLAAARAAWHRVGDLVANTRSWSLGSAARAALWASNAAGTGGPGQARRQWPPRFDSRAPAGRHPGGPEPRSKVDRSRRCVCTGRCSSRLAGQRLSLRLETLTAIDMAILLARSGGCRAAANEARAILTRLRAKPFLARFEAAVGRPMQPASEPVRALDASTV